MYSDAQGLCLVSACLAGFHCRYDGNGRMNERVCAMVRAGKAIPVCPEQLGGLSTPRAPSELQPSGIVRTIDGQDVTGAFQRGAEETLRICKLYGATHAILKSRSPSCGCGCVYDGSFSGTLKEGDGVTAALLKANGIPVESAE